MVAAIQANGRMEKGRLETAPTPWRSLRLGGLGKLLNKLNMSDLITVTVKLFAAYQEAYGRSQLVMQLPPQTPVATVLEQLIAEHPELQKWRNLTRFGVNLQFVPPETLLQDGDELVMIPPVSGG